MTARLAGELAEAAEGRGAAPLGAGQVLRCIGAGNDDDLQAPVGAVGDQGLAQREPVERTGRYLTVWKKQKDGSWKVVWDGGAADPKKP